MDILISPTRFLPNAGSQAVAEALERGARRCADVSRVVLRPIPEGGRGTIDAVVRAMAGRIRRSRTVNAMGRSIDARWAMLPDGTAWIDASEVLGGSEVSDLSRASSWGLGQLIAEVMRWGPQHMVISLGDVMTHDGGLGLLAFFGMKASDGQGRPLAGGLYALEHVEHIAQRSLTLPAVPLTVLFPRALPLTGPAGATLRDGVSKGLAPFQLGAVETQMQRYAGLLEEFWATGLAAHPGSGEGGGLAFALMGLGAQAQPAAAFLLDTLHIENYWAQADWVLTAQVSLDATQTLSLAPTLASRMQNTGIPLIVIVERLGDSYAQFYSSGIQGIYPLDDKPRSAKDTERGRIHLLEQAAFRVAMWMRA